MMADPEAFARTMARIAVDVEKNADASVVRTAIAINNAVILSTPVDTGRARANWGVEIGQPFTRELDSTDPGGVGTISQNNRLIAQRKFPDAIFISNNVPYINELNDGSSAQAPAGFVEMAVARLLKKT
jgi:hypothetical protein